ncbi:hypothetical protein HFP72_00260 [Nocardiopsis sp. ARC36]
MTATTSPPDHDARLRAGTAAYRRTVAAMVAVAVATFAQLWSVQPVLPAIADGFGSTASQAALTVSVATGDWPGSRWCGAAPPTGSAGPASSPCPWP